MILNSPLEKNQMSQFLNKLIQILRLIILSLRNIIVWSVAEDYHAQLYLKIFKKLQKIKINNK